MFIFGRFPLKPFYRKILVHAEPSLSPPIFEVLQMEILDEREWCRYFIRRL